MSAPILIHVLSLDTVGGVEALYVHYLKEALSRGLAIHYTCVSGKRPHPKFSEFLSNYMHRPFLEQYIMGVRLPKIFRAFVNIRRGMVEDIVKPTAWVFWNRVEDKPPPGRAIYYEHGASWSLSPTKKRKDFFNHCSTFIANSNAAAILLQKRWGVSSPITVVHNPLRPDIPLAAAPRKGLLSCPLRLGFVGRLVPVKGCLIPLHVLKQLSDARVPATLTIAGVGSLEHLLKTTAKKLGVADRVHFSGCVSDIGTWFDSIDVLLVPSIREPLGLVSLEAAARGVPVIAANVDGLPEVVIHEHSGLLVDPKIPIKKAGALVGDTEGLPDVVVHPTLRELVEPSLVDPTDVVNALFRFTNDPSLYERCSSQGLEIARQRSCFSAYYESLKSILEKEVVVDCSAS